MWEKKGQKPVAEVVPSSRLLSQEKEGEAEETLQTGRLSAPLPRLNPGRVDSKSAVMYSPFSGEDMLHGAGGRNESRARKNKSPLLLVARSDADRDILNAHRTSVVAKKFSEINDIYQTIAENGGDAAVEQKLGAERHRRIIENLQKATDQTTQLGLLQIKSNQTGQELNKLDPANTKIYIIAHGLAGDNELTSTLNGREQTISASALARQLADGGLSKDFIDFRLLSCQSADVETPVSFQQGASSDAAPQGFFSSIRERMGLKNQSFAESFANALLNEGFKCAQVSGYHGNYIVNIGSDHQVRVINKEGRVVESARQSHVRRVFFGTKGGRA